MIKYGNIRSFIWICFRKEETNKITDKTQGIRSSWFKTYFSNIWQLFLYVKNILIKLSLIGFFIQLFNKFKIFRVMWVMFNSIVMTIFGVSLLENFGFEFISNFLRETRNILRNIVDYLTDTKFYQSLENLYGKKESTLEKHSNEFETINKFNNKEDVIRRISENAERKELEKIDSTRKHYNTSKISDWLNGDKDSIPEVNTQADVENNRINYRKYLIIVGL